MCARGLKDSERLPNAPDLDTLDDSSIPVPKCWLTAMSVLRCKRFDGQTIDLAVTDVSMEEYHSLDLRNEDLSLDKSLSTADTSIVLTETSSSNPQQTQNLVKRHNYAMVRWENSQMTALCNEAGYFCNKNGRLQHKKDSKDDPDCTESGVCLCVDLFPQPRCFWQSSSFICARDTTPQIAAPASSVPNSGLELRDTLSLVKRHNYAMNCWNSGVMTALCAGLGYHCNSKGEFVLQKGRKGDKDCTDDVPCTCVDLFPKPKCFLQGTGVLGCVTRTDTNIDQLETPALVHENVLTIEQEDNHDGISTDFLERSLISLKHGAKKDLLVKRHDFVMSCLDNRDYTKICADVGYYCDRNGRLIYKGKGKGLAGCWKEQECQCMSLVAKPKCYLAISGSTACVSGRAEGSAEKIYHFDAAEMSTAQPDADLDGEIGVMQDLITSDNGFSQTSDLEIEVEENDEAYHALIRRKASLEAREQQTT